VVKKGPPFGKRTSIMVKSLPVKMLPNSPVLTPALKSNDI